MEFVCFRGAQSRRVLTQLAQDWFLMLELLNLLFWISNQQAFLCWIHALDASNISKDPRLPEVHFFLNLQVFLKSDRVLASVKTAFLELKTFHSYC